MTGVEIALAQAALDRRVFPIAAGTKVPLIKWKEGASTDPDVIRAWFRRWPDAAVGWNLPEGTVILDIDDPATWSAAKLIPPVVGPFQKTPRGFHFAYLQRPGTVVVQGPIPGGDLKVGGRGYVRIYEADAFTRFGKL